MPFIAMRYVAGSDLRRRIAREGRLEPAEAVGADRPGRQRPRRDPRRRPRPPRRQAGQRPAQRRPGRRARLHHRLRRRPQRRHPVRPDPDRALRRHPRLRRAGADLRRAGRRPRRRLRARLPALQAADRRGAVPARGRGGPPLRPSPRPAAGALAVRAGRCRWPSTTSSSGRCRSRPDDRYPSAGDLGRAAQAALSGTAVSIPERTVATGAAATRETAQARRAVTGPREVETGQAARRARRSGAPAPAAHRRRLMALVLVAAVVALRRRRRRRRGQRRRRDQRRDDDEGSEAEAEARAADADQGRADPPGRRDLRRKPRQVPPLPRSRSGGQVPDVAYSRVWSGSRPTPSSSSTRWCRRRRWSRPYDRYVASQREVRQWDRDALAAAEAEDADGLRRSPRNAQRHRTRPQADGRRDRLPRLQRQRPLSWPRRCAPRPATAPASARRSTPICWSEPRTTPRKAVRWRGCCGGTRATRPTRCWHCA